jgi:hypothetical protein
MPTKRRQWAKIDTTQAEEFITEKHNNETQARATKHEDLFFTDTVGNVESRQNKRKRNQAAMAKRTQPDSVIVLVPKTNQFYSTRFAKTNTSQKQEEKPGGMNIWGEEPAPRTEPHFPNDARFHKHVPAFPSHHVTALKSTFVSSISANPDQKLQQLSVHNALKADAKLKQEKFDLDLKLQGKHPSQLLDESVLRAPSEDEEQQVPGPARKKQKKLTISDRNKIERAKELARAQKEEVARKKFDKQLNNIPHILRDIAKEEKLAEQLRNEKAGHPKDPTTVKLSKHGPVQEFPEFLLTEELECSQGQLRKVSNSKHVVEDQFKRFFKRNLIENRVKQQKTKPKVGKKLHYRNAFKEDAHLFPKGTLKAAGLE